MNVLDNYECEGQISIWDLYDPDIWSGKTSPEPLAVTKVKISEPSLKKRQKSQTKTPLFLDLRTGKNGLLPGASWEPGGLLLGEYMTHSFGEYPKEEKESRLSQILEDSPHPKYSLSAKACQGILRRAEKRGKILPEQLKTALIRQSVSKNDPENLGGVKESSFNMNEQEHCQPLTINRCLNSWDVQSKHIQPENGIAEALYSGECRGGGGESYVMQSKVYGIGSYDSNAMKSSNPHSGIYEAETTRTLDNNGGNPACNQGGMIVLEGNGQRDSHKGDGYKESETMYTLNTVEQHAVLATQQAIGEYKIGGGSIQPETERLQGCNGFGDTVGALCAADAKGAGNQYVNDGKCIIQPI